MKADEVRRFQRQLITLGYLAHGQDDGVFGQISIDAFNHYRATKGLPPVTTTTLDELESVLFPKPPKPVSANALAILWALLPVFTKGTAMTSDQLTGVLRAILALVSGYFIGKGIGSADLWNWIIAGVTGVIPFVWTWINNRPKTITPIGK